MRKIVGALMVAGAVCTCGWAQTRVAQYAVVYSSHFVVSVGTASATTLNLTDVISICSEATFLDLYLANFDTAGGNDVYYRIDGVSSNVRTTGVPIVYGDEQFHRIPYYPVGGKVYLIGTAGASTQTVRGLLFVRK